MDDIVRLVIVCVCVCRGGCTSNKSSIFCSVMLPCVENKEQLITINMYTQITNSPPSYLNISHYQEVVQRTIAFPVMEVGEFSWHI